jgi:hypothetical protein
MLNPLMLDNWTVTGSTKPEPKLTELQARYDLAPEACLKCGTVTKLEVHARPKQRFFDTPGWGGRVEVVVGRARFKCPHCSGTFMQPLPDMAESYKMTRRCALYAAEQGIQSQYAVVARRIGVDEKTVRSLVKIYGQQALAARGITAPVILGIDELTLLDDRRSIFTNVGEREVIYPLDLFVCESCLGQFHNSQRSQAVFYPVNYAGLTVAEMPPGSGRPHDLCASCAERTHRFAVPFLGTPPTG